MNQPILDFENSETPKSYFNKFRILRWVLLAMTCLVLFLDFIPEWKNVQNILIACFFVPYLVLLGWACIQREASLQLLTKSKGLGFLLGIVTIFGAFLLPILIWSFSDEEGMMCSVDYIETIEKQDKIYYIYNKSCWMDRLDFRLKKRISFLPIMYTVASGLWARPQADENRILLGNGNFYDITTDELVINNPTN